MEKPKFYLGKYRTEIVTFTPKTKYRIYNIQYRNISLSLCMHVHIVYIYCCVYVVMRVRGRPIKILQSHSKTGPVTWSAMFSGTIAAPVFHTLASHHSVGCSSIITFPFIFHIHRFLICEYLPVVLMDFYEFVCICT